MKEKNEKEMQKINKKLLKNLMMKKRKENRTFTSVQAGRV